MQILGISSTSPGYQRQPLMRIVHSERSHRRFEAEPTEIHDEYSPTLLSDDTLETVQHLKEDLEEAAPLEPAKVVVNHDGSVNLVSYNQLLVSEHNPYVEEAPTLPETHKVDLSA